MGRSRLPLVACALAAICAAAEPAMATTAAAPAHAAASADGANKFNIWEFRILGAHVLPVRVIERAVYPYLGPSRDINSVKAAVASLEQAYKKAGYGAIYVDIPEQEVSEGIVRLRVTEGLLARVRVRGERYFSGRQILAQLPALELGQTPNLPALSKQVAVLNAETADRTVTPVLEAGSTPGTMDVDLDVKDQLPLHGSVQFDNRHTADTVPNRVTGSLSYDNLWQAQHSLSLVYQTAPSDPRNDVIESATYLAPLGGPNSVSFSYSRTSSNVLALGTLGVLGSGDIYGAHWDRAMTISDASAGALDLGADFKHVNTEVLPNPTNGTSTTAVTAPVKYINWSGTYAENWRLPTNTLAMSLGINYGVQGLENYETEFENARYQASPSYLYLRLSGQATQNLPFGVSLLGRFTGQWSDSPLINNEQFSLGGVDTVRGYLEAEALGDTGIAGSFELHLPDLGQHLVPAFNQLYTYAFVDGGVATLLDPLPAQFARLSLWSTGAGVRFVNPWGLTGALDYAIPMVFGVQTKKGDSHVDFSVRYGF